MMSLLDLLREHESDLAEKWLASVFNTYPIDTVGFLRTSKDQFANPVGQRTTQAVRGMLRELLAEGLDPDAVREPADLLIRIRTIQEFSPAQALAPIFFLKTIVRELVDKQKDAAALAGDLRKFESKVDSLALICVNIYTECTTQVYQMRIDEVKRSQRRLLELAGMICGTTAEDSTDK